MRPEDFLRKWALASPVYEGLPADHPGSPRADLKALLDAEREVCAAGIAALVKQRDEAHARAEKAERERDEARAAAKESAASDMDSLQRLKAVEPTLERLRIERDAAERSRDEWKARAEKAEAELASLKTRRFPVIGYEGEFWVPWSVVEPFGAQAEANHGQTLEKIAARGGLWPRELWRVVNQRRWSDPDCPSEADCHAWALRLAKGETP